MSKKIQEVKALSELKQPTIKVAKGVLNLATGELLEEYAEKNLSQNIK